jgi:hypothetical protein
MPRRRPRPKLSGIAKQSQKLTGRQARFILDCLTYDFEMRRAQGKRLSNGLYAHLGHTFNVSPDTIKDIWFRRKWSWLPIRNIYDISQHHRSQLQSPKSSSQA